MEKYELAIIGGGLSGLTAAVEADKLGIKTILFEKEAVGGLAFNGGDVVLNHLFKLLRKSIDSNSDNRKNIFSYIKEKQHQYKNEYIQFLKSAKNIDVALTKAYLIDEHKICSDGKLYYADKIILSYGAKMNIPEIKGLDVALENGFAKLSKDILKHTFNEKSICIYGGGKVGIEFAHFASNMGFDTYVLARSQILKDIDEDAKDVYLRLIARPNLHIIEEATIKEVFKNKVIYEINGVLEQLEVDSLIIATGVVPNFEVTENLNIEFDNEGIIVNNYMQTNIPNIYAVGDTNFFPKYSNLAIAEAIIAIRHLTYERITFDHLKLIKNSSGLIQYSFIGLSEGELIKNNIPYEKEVIELDSEIHSLFFFKVLIHKMTREILRIIIISRDSNKDLNTILDMLDNELNFIYNNRNNLFSSSYQVKNLLYKGLIDYDEKLIYNNHEIVYQPKICSKSYQVLGAELLSRFKIDGKYTNPLPFINIFEKHNTIIKLDLKMLEAAAKFLKELDCNNLINNDFKLSINFSIATINTFNPLKFFQLIDKYDVSPTQIIIEITERVTENNEARIEHLNELKKYGFIISMDDFSVGNSSLNLLNIIDFDEVKIDMSLLPKDEKDYEKIQTFDNILELIHSRNISVIAEGVETIEQVKLLDKRDLTGYQGYYFSRPISSELFKEYLINKNLEK